jgi:thioredoxin 1
LQSTSLPLPEPPLRWLLLAQRGLHRPPSPSIQAIYRAQTSITNHVSLPPSLDDLNSAIKNTSKLVVIDSFATWCPPCKAIAPKVEEYSEIYSEGVEFYKVDVDEAPDVAQELGIRAMPTFIFFKNGEKVDEVMGAVPPAIVAAVQKHSA